MSIPISRGPRKHSRVSHLLQHSRLDSKGEAKHRTYCPTTWTHCYQWAYTAQYADQLRQANASPLLCKECTLLVRIQLSKKSANHPDCAFADCASTTMCGAMISLTPCIAPTVSRDCDLDASVSFKDENDMIKQLNTILSIPRGFPQIPNPGKIAMCSMPSQMSDTSRW